MPSAVKRSARARKSCGSEHRGLCLLSQHCLLFVRFDKGNEAAAVVLSLSACAHRTYYAPDRYILAAAERNGGFMRAAARVCAALRNEVAGTAMRRVAPNDSLQMESGRSRPFTVSEISDSTNTLILFPHDGETPAMANTVNVLGLSSRALIGASRVLARSSQWLDRLQQQRLASSDYPKKLNVGCGYDKRAGYLNIDVDPACNPDLLIVHGDFSTLPRHYFEHVLAKDVLEHVPRTRTLDLLLDFADYLVDDGELIIQTSSVLHIAAKLKGSKQYADHHGWTVCLFGTQQHPGDFHYTGFTALTLQINLIAAGFAIETLELREGWMFYVEARKTTDWTSILKTKVIGDREFISEAYQAALYREAEEKDILVCLKALREGMTHKQLLKQLFSTPERLFKTAARNEHSILPAYKINYSPFVHNDARIESLDGSHSILPLRIQTDNPMYSYAVSFGLDPLSLDDAGEVQVAVDIKVESGVIGLACTTSDFSSFVDQEIFVQGGTQRQVCIPTGAPFAAHHLIVRNQNFDGHSIANIYGIEMGRRRPANASGR